MAQQNEAQARIKINQLLESSGWRLVDGPEGKANVRVEQPTKASSKKGKQVSGGTATPKATGYIDYLLLDSNNYPLAVLEAKKQELNPLNAKEQARRYARQQGVRFVILSNGKSHFLWDLQSNNPEPCLRLPTQKALQYKFSYKTKPTQLCREVVDEDYIAREQKPELVRRPDWSARKSELAQQEGLKILRPYQLKAIQALQKEVQNNEHKKRFLFEMATGTGKTLLAAAVIKLFLRTENARRVLFLVDRVELENQADKSLACLGNSYTCGIYKDYRSDWNKLKIVVSTVQSLIDVYGEKFEPSDFDLLISDEAHRSIGGKSRAIFEYFEGFKLGLTATPRDYLKNIDAEKLSDSHLKKFERRLWLDTYKIFGCVEGVPTFKYDLVQGVKDNYLISPTVIDARTEVTAQLLSDKGYAIEELEKNVNKDAGSEAGALPVLDTEVEQAFTGDTVYSSVDDLSRERVESPPPAGTKCAHTDSPSACYIYP